MKKTIVATCALSVGLLLTACSSDKKSDSSSSTTAKESSSTTAAPASTTTAASSTTPPTVAGLTKTGTKSISDGGTMTSYTVAEPASTLISDYTAALEKAGYKVDGSGGGGGGRWSGGGLTATTANSYLVVSAGGSSSKLYVDVCTWPSKPKNDDCGDNDNQN